MFENCSKEVMRAMLLAEDKSIKRGNRYVGTEHLLIGILEEGSGIGHKLLKSYGVNSKTAEVELNLIMRTEKSSGFIKRIKSFFTRKKREKLDHSVLLEDIFKKAKKEALEQDRLVTVDHLILALLEDKKTLSREIVSNLGADILDIYEMVSFILSPKTSKADKELSEEIIYSTKIEDTSVETLSSDELKLLSIKAYTTDMTAAVLTNMDPVIGRTKEIERVIQILARRRKNNPVLLGDPGVGKTAVAEGLAQRIASNKVPALLQNKRIISLNVGSLLAGARYRGEFEARLKLVLDVCKSLKAILFIDEIHTIVGAGSGDGAVDAANLLKPALARGELQCFGATTKKEYSKYIERDPALERRFQPVKVEEPNIPDTIKIITGISKNYALFHNVTYTLEALRAAVNLSSKHIADRFLPDKAIDLIDEAGAKVKLAAYALPDAAAKLDSELQFLIKLKETAVEKQDYKQAEQLKVNEADIRDQIKIIIESYEISSDVLEKATVNEEDIAEIISTWTGVPVKKLSKDESENLVEMENILHKRIIGQHHAVVSVSKAVRRARLGLRNPNRPIASFIFAGPTGVGKTELAKVLASFFFGSEDSMVRLDMSEFMEKHTVSKLIGSPPGYVGYEEGGQLTEAVRKKPYTVVLFDEIEKAHLDVFNMLLQILEDGRLTDSHGRVIDFTNTLLILTSNLGAKIIEKESMKDSSTLVSDSKSSNNTSYKRIFNLVNAELKNHFKPEFLNRLDEIIVFSQLTRDDISKIANILISQLAERVKLRGFNLEVTDRLKEKLVEDGFDPAYGARPLRRAVVKLLEDNLATTFLRSDIEAGMTFTVDVDGNNEVIISSSHKIK